MTNPTPHGQVPAIQRYKIGYHSDEWGVRSSTPSGIPDASGPWVRYEDHAAVITALRTQQPCPTAPAAPALTQGAAIAAGAVYAELPDDVIDHTKGSYAFLQSTAPDGYAEEVFRLPPSATRNQRSLQDALQSDKRGWHPAAARQDSGDGKRSGPDAGVSASHGQAPAGATEPTEQQILEAAFAPALPAAQQGAAFLTTTPQPPVPHKPGPPAC